MLSELDTRDAIHSGTAARVQRLDKALRKWNTGTPHDEVIRAARARMNEICAKGPQIKADSAKTDKSDDASSACRNFLTT